MSDDQPRPIADLGQHRRAHAATSVFAAAAAVVASVEHNQLALRSVMAATIAARALSSGALSTMAQIDFGRATSSDPPDEDDAA